MKNINSVVFKRLVVVFGVGLWTTIGANAQIMRGGVRGRTSGEFIEPDRALRQELGDAQSAIAEERYGDAIIVLGDLLARKGDPQSSEMQGQDFFQPNPESQNLWSRSVLRDAETMLGQLPTKGIETYELRYGATAADELQRAVAAGDWNGIASVSRHYLITSAGQQATLLIGYHDLLQGHPLAAALTFDRLYGHQRIRNSFGTKLSVALAGSWYQAGFADRAEEVLKEVGERASVKIDGEQSHLPDAIEERMKWLTQRFPKLNHVEHDQPLDQPVAGGALARTGYRGGELSMRNERWMKKTTWSIRQQEYLEDFQSKRSDSLIPSWQPIVVGNTVLAKTTEGMVAVDFSTGKFIWEYPWFSENLSGSGVPTSEIPNDDERNRLLVQRVWNDLPYGRISSDGQRAYMLMGLGEVKIASFSRFAPMGNQGIRKANGGENSLVALDLDTEGKLVWTASSDESSENTMEDVFFLGPPLPVDGSLYVIAEQKGDIYLMCMNPTTGSLRWRQHLVAVETGTIDQDPIRRISGAMPVYADGTLVCPTGHGAIVAFDLSTRTFRWGFRYNRTDGAMSHSFSGRNRTDLSTYLDRWHDSTPVIYQGKVLFTAIEGNALFALDLMTGEPVWSSPLRRESWRYLAGTVDQMAILVGSQAVAAKDIETGENVWEYQLVSNSNEMINGRGVFGDGNFIVPTSANRLIEINTTNGDSESVQQVSFPLGNLVSLRGQLLSQSSTHLAIARGKATTEKMVAKALLADPNDFESIIRKGELLLEDGQRDEALRWLQRAFARDSKSEDVRKLLIEAMLSALRDDFHGYSEHIPLLDRLAELPAERNRLHRIMADGALEREDYEEAARYLLNLSVPPADALGLGAYHTEEIKVNHDHCVTNLDGWISARVNRIFKQASEKQLRTINDLIAQRIEELTSPVGDLASQLQRHFRLFSATDVLTKALVTRYLSEGLTLHAERILLDQIEAVAEQDRRDRWLGILATIYIDADWTEDASVRVAEIQDMSVLEDVDGVDLASIGDLSKQPRRPSLDQDTERWPTYVHKESETKQSSPNTIGKAKRLQVLGSRGQLHKNWKVLLGESTDTIHMQSSLGAFAMQYNLESEKTNVVGPMRVYTEHGLMIAILPTAVVAFDLFQGMNGEREIELWRRPLQTGGSGIQVGNDTNEFRDMQRTYLTKQLPTIRVSAVEDGQMVFLESKRLSSVDLMTGEDRWVRSVSVEDGFLATGDGTVALISPQAGQVELFDVHDGRALGRKQWIEPTEKIWATADTHALSYRVGQNNKLNLRLWNAVSGEQLLEMKDMNAETVGKVVSNRYVVVIQSDGALFIWDIVKGMRLTESRLPIEHPVRKLEVLPWADRLVVMPLVDRPQSPDDKKKYYTSLANWHVSVNGPAMAFRLDDGKPAWEAPLDIENYGVTLNQPTGSPLMFLSRREKPTNSGDAIARWSIAMAALDVRSGKIAFSESGLVTQRSIPQQITTHVVVRPDEPVFNVTIDRNHMQFKLRDVPPPPAPEPEDLGEQTNVKPKGKPFGLFEPVE